MAAFQLADDRFSSGLFGTDAFGTSAFGGTAWAPLTLELHLPGDDLSFDGRQHAAKIEHRRLGLLVGVRTFASGRLWRVVMQGKTQDEVDDLRPFHEAGEFYLLQDDDETGRRVLVSWLGDFDPVNQTGGWYDFDFQIEEIIR